MNLRALTRGDAAVAGAAILLLIASFLPYGTTETCRGSQCASLASLSGWSMALYPVLPAVFFLGLIGAALVLLQRFQGEAAEGRQVLGLRLDQWGTALSVAALWSSVWSLLGGPDDLKGEGSTTSFGHGFGAWLAVVALLVLTGAASAGPLVPALQEPLLPEPKATPAPPQQQAQPYQPYQQAPGGQPAGQQPGVPGQYGGYQGSSYGQAMTTPLSQPGAPLPSTTPLPQPSQSHSLGGGYSFAPDASAQEATALLSPITDVTPAPSPMQAHAAPFQPYWFAVPAIRQLAPRDNPMGPPVGELVPGTWYLAVEERRNGLVAQLPNGTPGLLTDTSGIQRG